jgi:hypothetical protein
VLRGLATHLCGYGARSRSAPCTFRGCFPPLTANLDTFAKPRLYRSATNAVKQKQLKKIQMYFIVRLVKKADHTELAILSRLLLRASVVGVAALTYGEAAASAHLSRGGLQRYFPTAADMQMAVLTYGYARMEEATFGWATETAARSQSSPEDAHEMAFSRWLSWIGGDLALPGGCILIPALGHFNDEENPAHTAPRALVQAQWQAWLQRLDRIDHAFEYDRISRARIQQDGASFASSASDGALPATNPPNIASTAGVFAPALAGVRGPALAVTRGQALVALGLRYFSAARVLYRGEAAAPLREAVKTAAISEARRWIAPAGDVAG